MKRLLVVLLLAAPSLWGQQRFVAAPYLNMSTVDSLMVISGQDTLRGKDASVEGSLASIDTGQVIVSTKFPNGTYVVGIIDSITFLVSEEATATDTVGAADTVQFSYYTNTAYAAGDVYGTAFKAPSFNTIYSAQVMDTTSTQDSVKIIFFDGEPSQQYDNAVFAPTDADVAKIIGIIPIATSDDMGGGNLIYTPSTFLPLRMDPTTQVWIRLVAWGAADHKAVRSIRLLLVGE